MPYGREGTNVFLLCLCHCTSWFCSFCSPSIPALSPRILFLLPPSNQSPQSGLGPLLLSGPCLLVTPITLQGCRGSQISSPQVRLWGSVIHPQFLLETQSEGPASPLHFQGALLLPPVTVLSTCRAISHPPAPAGPGVSPEALASGLCSIPLGQLAPGLTVCPSVLSASPHSLQNPVPEATLSLLCSLFTSPSKGPENRSSCVV